MVAKSNDIEAIYNAALEKASETERSAYLDAVCGRDPVVRARVEALLKAHNEAGDFLEAPVFDADVTLDDSPLTEGPGTVIGNYKLLELIGEGGMASVYMAEQEKPLRRRVALKIIKLGMDTKSVIARFEVERQALAMMDHPNIARVLDAGATETGRSYFVMELVKGVSITAYCDKNKLSTKKRLDLFTQVCNAVQHAHQKGIIHRDIKPSNVMVTLHDGKPVPKVIDFGIAKAINQRLTEKTLFTRYAQMIGTPAYMSPEQAEFSELNIDTRTDIYSLGVLLYELLTGATPFSEEELREAGYLEMQRIIREEEPAKPSTKLSTLGDTLTDVAEHRKASPDLLRKLVSGDLDWIVMKSLEKDRTRRYDTVVELAADIARHLNNELVVAAAPSALYRVRKFVKRNRAFVTGLAAVLVVLIAGITVSAIFACGQFRASAEAQRQSKIANGVNDFFCDRFLWLFSPYRDEGGAITPSSILVAASNELEGKFEDEPLIEASIRYRLGTASWGLGDLSVAETQYRAAYEIRREQLGDEHPQTINSLGGIAACCRDLCRYKEAEQLYLRVIQSKKRALGAEHASTLYTQHQLGLLYMNAGRYRDWEPLSLALLDSCKRVLGSEHSYTILAISNTGRLRAFQGRYAEAEPLLVSTLQLSQDIKGKEHAWTQEFTGWLGWLRHLQGRYAEAEPLLTESLDMCRRMRGDDHPDTLVFMNFFGSLRVDQGRYSEAESLFVEAVKMGRRKLGDKHASVLTSINGLAVVYRSQGRFGEAEPLLREALDGRTLVLGAEHPDTLESMNDLALLYKDTEHFDEAERLFLTALERRNRKLREQHPDTIETIKNLVEMYEAWDKPELAKKWRGKLPGKQDLKEQ